jgi:hypothetical protein
VRAIVFRGRIVPLFHRAGALVMYTASPRAKSFGSPFTVGTEGSFGTLHYAVVALDALDITAGGYADAQQCLLAPLALLGRGFRPARTVDLEDIVLKAQLADGSVRCRASTEGLILLVVDNRVVWSRQYDPEDPDTALWLEAARTRDVTILSCGLHAWNAGDGYSASDEPLMMAKVPIEWTH